LRLQGGNIFVEEVLELVLGQHAINHPEVGLFVGFDFISNFVIINNAPAWLNFDEGWVIMDGTTLHIILQYKSRS